MTVDDAHSVVIAALDGDENGTVGLYDLRLADLNETEREHALDALAALQDLDAALAERSSYSKTDRPADLGRVEA